MSDDLLRSLFEVRAEPPDPWDPGRAGQVHDELGSVVRLTDGSGQVVERYGYGHYGQNAIERVCREAGYEPAVICTPEELTNEYQG